MRLISMLLILLISAGCGGASWVVSFDPVTGQWTMINETEGTRYGAIGADEYEALLNVAISRSRVDEPDQAPISPDEIERAYNLQGEANLQIRRGQLSEAHDAGMRARSILGHALRCSDDGQTVQTQRVRVDLDTPEIESVLDHAATGFGELDALTDSEQGTNGR